MLASKYVMFKLETSRDGKVVSLMVCDGKRHYYVPFDRNFLDFEQSLCDAHRCRGEDARPLDAALISPNNARYLKVEAPVPVGMVLARPLTSWEDKECAFSGGALVCPPRLPGDKLLRPGEYAVVKSGVDTENFVANDGAQGVSLRLGRKGSWLNRRRLRKALGKLETIEVSTPVEPVNADQLGALIFWQQKLQTLPRTDKVKQRLAEVDELIQRITDFTSDELETQADQVADDAGEAIQALRERVELPIMAKQLARQELKSEEVARQLES